MKKATKTFCTLLAIGVFSCASWSSNKINQTEDYEIGNNYTKSLKHDTLDSFLQDGFYIEGERKIYDFFGNEFKLYELKPCGYAIYAIKDEASAFIEGSYSTNSPFYEHNNEVYYMGPGEYYFANENNDIIDITTDENICIDVESLQKRNIKLNESIFYKTCAEENETNETSTYSFQIVDDFGGGGGGTSGGSSGGSVETGPTTTYRGFTCIKDYEYFKNLTQFPLNKYGTCGITALCIIIGYMDEYINQDYITAENESRFKSGNGTTNELRDLLFDYEITFCGLGNDEDGYPITATEINSMMKKYLKEETTEDLQKNTKKNWGILFCNTHNGPRNRIDEGIPAILSMTNYYCDYEDYEDIKNKWHSVVAYGYNKDDDTFLVHMGWGVGETKGTEIIVSDASIYSYATFYYEN